uniref:Ribonuclease HII n=1 Tax=viral metagenome TaxID=1070528 RepID=A0A6C0BT59_9ZZZZ
MDNTLNKSYNNDSNIFEIGVDEAGRGPLLGRVYAAAVILPHENFNFSILKDSKKFSSKKKLLEVYNYIKENALYYSVNYADESLIDDINILQATMQTMHKSIKDVIKKSQKDNYFLLIDGNYFKPITYVTDECELYHINYETIKGGDNLYCSIAAASILAKVERDNYIDELCQNNPYLIDNYSINTNKGYAAKKHRDGIEKHGLSPFHRKTYGICKKYS